MNYDGKTVSGYQMRTIACGKRERKSLDGGQLRVEKEGKQINGSEILVDKCSLIERPETLSEVANIEEKKNASYPGLGLGWKLRKWCTYHV